MGDLTKNFDRSEFACKCGCGFDTIDGDLVGRLQNMRDALGPLRISSGCRCAKRNAEVGGAKDSAHVAGHAVDLILKRPADKYAVIQEAFRQGIRGIGVYASQPLIVHLDMAPADRWPRPALWANK